MNEYKEATYKIILILYKGNTAAAKVFLMTYFFPVCETLIHHPAPFSLLFLLKTTFVVLAWDSSYSTSENPYYSSIKLCKAEPMYSPSVVSTIVMPM